jgi:hypothetical protein
MTRAGREPAEDVKRRLVTGCQEVGLQVASARMHLLKDQGVRVIHVESSLENWPHGTSMVSLMATITVNGEWSQTVDIRCCATDDDPVQMNAPWMKGRGNVPLGCLVDHLRETLDEREQVIAAIKLGVAGPYAFERSVWDVFNPLAGIE